jgi:hypothetical protein
MISIRYIVTTMLENQVVGTGVIWESGVGPPQVIDNPEKELNVS